MTDHDINRRESIGLRDSRDGLWCSDRGRAAGVGGDVNMDFFEDPVFIHSQTSQPEPSPGDVGALPACRVRGGDTPWGISRGFGITVGRLATPNHISNPNVICKGQILEILDVLKA